MTVKVETCMVGELMMTLLVVSVFIISVMNTVLNISVVTEADAPRPAAGRPRAEDRTESKPHVDTRRPCACTGVSVLRLDAEAQNQASTWLRAGPSFSPGASVGTGRAETSPRTLKDSHPRRFCRDLNSFQKLHRFNTSKRSRVTRSPSGARRACVTPPLSSPIPGRHKIARVCARSFPPCQSPSSSQHSRAIKPGAAGQESSTANAARGRSWAGPSAGTARARGAANQRPRRAGRRGQRGAGCHRRLARAAGGNLEVPPPPPQEGPGLAAPSGLREPFPATQRRSDAGESVGKSRCAGTREQPYLSSALPLLFSFEEGCAGERRPGSVRGRRGTLPATQGTDCPLSDAVPAGVPGECTLIRMFDVTGLVAWLRSIISFTPISLRGYALDPSSLTDVTNMQLFSCY
ncbi:uncharacterized protein LOC123331190 [Bubalus bubalis]|uniref:uncharacterized protein LOC123331190 n=1 Tax=Bubalus bubalis TaxID=89462 RepID=UPI001D107453|nr:uncharacterized protein LOC123331190 [Bubalus bubalis]